MEKKRHTTASGEDYLEAILVLQKKIGMVRPVDIARHMGFTKPSITHAITTLQTGGFVERDEDGFIRLTDVGREVAERTYEKHCFFTEMLIEAGVDQETAEADACRMEHAISEDTMDKWIAWYEENYGPVSETPASTRM